MNEIQPLLFTPLTIKDVELKNRIVMSPMFTHAADENGSISDWQFTHYTARALGQAGLVFLEAMAISEYATVGANNLGIWSDAHIEDLSKIVGQIQTLCAKAGAQLSHPGRAADHPKSVPMGPSSIPFSDISPVPGELSQQGILKIIEEYGEAAKRATNAGFDILELHGAHGGLINQFLSPLSNHRSDGYGGNPAYRYRFVREIISEVKKHWNGPLFIRISSTDYVEGGNTPESFIEYASLMKEDGVDLIDCSSGGIAPVKVDAYPNYQVHSAELIKRETGLLTGAVGLIESGKQAEEILQNGRADLIFIGRAFLRDPFWPRTAAVDLDAQINIPFQYTRYGSTWLQ